MGPQKSPISVAHNGLSSLEECVQCTLHGVEYMLSVSTSKDEVLTVEVEQCSDASRWRGEFTQRYVEDITSKTGNFKKYHVFAKMLLSALKGASDSVFIDLLTYEDLEALKSRRAPHQDSTAAALHPKIPKNNKRYLILTYSSEFDRVHYPLPLVYEENPDPGRLKEIIRELRMQVAGMSQNGGVDRPRDCHMDTDMVGLREENAVLKRRLEGMYSEGATEDRKEAREAMREMRLALKERDILLRRAEAAEAELERERATHCREGRRHIKEVQELGDELTRCQQDLRDLRIKNRELTRQLDSVQPRNARRDTLRSISRGRAPRSVPDRKVSPARSKGVRSNRSASSRGVSPSSSAMSQSSCDERSSRSRPRSGPARARFDPTHYIQKKKEREKVAAQRKRFNGSGFGSGRSSSADSRASSTGRSQRSHRTASNFPPRKPLLPNSSTNRVREERSRRHPTHAYPTRSQRALSPGQALQDVKRKLNEFKPSRQARMPSPRDPSVDSSHDCSEDDVQEEVSVDRYENETRHRFDDGNVELADVDSRLQALQNFLRMAKASATSTEM